MNFYFEIPSNRDILQVFSVVKSLKADFSQRDFRMILCAVLKIKFSISMLIMANCIPN